MHVSTICVLLKGRDFQTMKSMKNHMKAFWKSICLCTKKLIFKNILFCNFPSPSVKKALFAVQHQTRPWLMLTSSSNTHPKRLQSWLTLYWERKKWFFRWEEIYLTFVLSWTFFTNKQWEAFLLINRYFSIDNRNKSTS